MTEMTLEAAPRKMHGKGGARKLRAQNLIPGILYGLHDPISLQLNRIELERLVHQLHGSERMISLRLTDGNGGSQARHVIVKEVQTTATGGHLLHVDLHEIDISQTVTVSVEVQPVGTPAGIKMGGTLQTIQREVTVECLPSVIPEYLEVDVSRLDIGDSLHVSDIVLPEGVTLLADPEETLFVLSGLMVEAGEAEQGAEGEAAAGETAAGEAGEAEGQEGGEKVS